MELVAKKRMTGKAADLRSEGHIPGIIYNRIVNLPVSVELRAFDKVFRAQGTSSIIDLNVEGDTRAVLVKAVQMDKRRREPQHVDFYEVTANETVDVPIHIELLGTPAGVKDGGLLDVQKREVLVRVLPRFIPDNIQLDVSALTIGDSLHVSALLASLPKEVEVLDDPEATLVAVVPPRVETEATEETGAEPEVISKGKDEDEDND